MVKKAPSKPAGALAAKAAMLVRLARQEAPRAFWGLYEGLRAGRQGAAGEMASVTETKSLTAMGLSEIDFSGS